MTGKTEIPTNITATIQQNWAWILALGIALIIGGFVLIAAPLASSIAVTLLIAAVMFIGGAIQIFQAFRTKEWTGFLWSLIIGVIAMIGGIIIYANPLAGTFALALVIAAVFIAQGISQLILAFKVKPAEGWIWVAIAGVVSVIAGIMIWFEFPFSAGWALGLIAGISVLFNGWSYVALAMAAKKG